MKYTPEITEQLPKDWEAGETVDSLALKLNVPRRSIITKLSYLKVYKRPGYKNKQGETPVSKAQLLTELADLLEVDIEIIDSLEKANKNVLKLLKDRLSKDRGVQNDLSKN